LQILGTNVDTIHQSYCPGAVRYVVTAEGESLTPRLGEMTALMDPQRSDTAGTLIFVWPQSKLWTGERLSKCSAPVTPRRSIG
jgi:hypothetical protein